jgi:hypothetical protein
MRRYLMLFISLLLVGVPLQAQSTYSTKTETHTKTTTSRAIHRVPYRHHHRYVRTRIVHQYRRPIHRTTTTTTVHRSTEIHSAR